MADRLRRLWRRARYFNRPSAGARAAGAEWLSDLLRGIEEGARRANAIDTTVVEDRLIDTSIIASPEQAEMVARRELLKHDPTWARRWSQHPEGESVVRTALESGVLFCEHDSWCYATATHIGRDGGVYCDSEGHDASP